MLIEAPCRLGEKFTHHRSYSNPKEQYLLGIPVYMALQYRRRDTAGRSIQKGDGGLL